MKLTKQKTIITLISIIFISLFILLIDINKTISQSNPVCSDLEFLKTTSEGIKCSRLPDRTSTTYITKIIETIIRPEISAPPIVRPTCAENERYTFKGGSWGCRDRFLLGIEFVGCPAGKYLNRITGGVICSGVVAADISTSFHQHSNYATAAHSHPNTFSLQEHPHIEYLLKTHSHTYPTCADSYVLNYTSAFSCRPPFFSIVCPEEQLLTSTGSGFECLKPSWTEVITTGTKWSTRYNHQAVVLGTNIYVLGGGAGSSRSTKNDVWKSTDSGVTWTEVITTGTKWSERSYHQAVVLGTDIYVLGGRLGFASPKNDIWKSTDSGVTWTEVITTGTKWSQRDRHQAVVLGTDIYVLGGYGHDSSPKNDVWKSTDSGVTWTEVITTRTKWSGRWSHQAIVLGTDIYVLGGGVGSSTKNDIWKSTDKGVTWTEVITTGTKWSQRDRHQAVVLGTDIYILGGHDGSNKNDVWKSTDKGVTWTEVITTGTKWSQRISQEAVVLGTNIYVLGGLAPRFVFENFLNDVWKYGPLFTPSSP